MEREDIRNYCLSTTDAAQRLGLSSSTLTKLRLNGTGPAFHKLGRRVVYTPVDLDAWLASRRRTSTSDDGGANV